MTKYIVTGYLVTNYSVEIESEDHEAALELGYDLLMEGEKVEKGDSAWQDEFDVFEVVN